LRRRLAELHLHPYFSKVDTFTPKAGEEVGRTLAEGRRDGTGRDRQHQQRRLGLRHPHSIGQRPRHQAAHGGGQSGFLLHSLMPRRDLCIGGEDAGQGPCRNGFRHAGFLRVRGQVLRA
jgi:hypothetical protein